MAHLFTKKRYLTFGGIVLFLIGLNVLFVYSNPREIVDFIGVENSYLVVFLIAAIGGLSSFTGTVYFSTLATFGAGVPFPFLLGLVGGLGIFISDTIFYLLATYGRESIPEKWESAVTKVSRWVQQWPTWVILTGVYAYISFTPLPNDLLVLALVLAGYKYKQLWWAILLGSLTISLLVVFFGKNLFG